MSFFKELKRRNVFRVGIAYTVATWLLIQVTDTVFPRIGLPESAVTLVIALLVIGFIPALIFAWAFEMTPDGIKREKDVDRTKSTMSNTGRKLDRMIIGILTVTVGYLLIDKLVLQPPEPVPVEITRAEATGTEAPVETNPSIAVLPFINMSADVENEYFSDGISEELLNVLVKVSTLHVASRTSSFAYKGKDLPISQIANELRVTNVLEGSVRKAGNRVRITAQLIDAQSDRHIWSETYERELVDIFDIQEEISNNIVAALKVVLNVDETAALERAQHPTANAEAYEIYLQGRYAWRQRHKENILKSIELFEQAIAMDPTFARAYEALASAWAILPVWSDVGNQESMQHAKPAAVRALQLDATLSEARAVLAEVAFDEGQWLAAINEYEQALELDPRNPTLHQWLGEALVYMGFLSEGVEELKIAFELDPGSPVINQSLVWGAAMNREDELAFKHVEIAKGIGIGDRAIYNAVDASVRRGTLAEDISELELNGAPAISLTCLLAHQDASLLTQLPAQIDQFLEDLDGAKIPLPVAVCLALTGQTDRAANLALKDMQNSWMDLWVFWGSSKQAGEMRQTEIFRETLADMGLLDFYRNYGWPDLCRAVGEQDFECDQ
ncbi:MAG: tetratricopeptide repeat protein [Xanthomonadales bacterium]|nr:tetratricopeptide repeat protein [Xanthomonadales bacterium]